APVTTPRRMLLALALTGGAWGAHVFGRALPTWGAVLVWAGLAWPIALGLARRRRIRCAAFRAAYLLPTGRLGTVYRGGALIALQAAVIAALAAAVLLTALVRLDDTAVWIVLVIGAPAAVLADRLVRRGLAREANPRYL